MARAGSLRWWLAPASGRQSRCPPAATASRMAKNTENGSNSGGSPTALLRWMESFGIGALEHRCTLKPGGQSLAVGILWVLGACVIKRPVWDARPALPWSASPCPWMKAPSTWPASRPG